MFDSVLSINWTNFLQLCKFGGIEFKTNFKIFFLKKFFIIFKAFDSSHSTINSMLLKYYLY